MNVISKRETARLLQRLCAQHNASPQDMIRRIHTTGVHIMDDIVLRAILGEHSRVYYLHRLPSTTGAFEIHVDGVCIHTESKQSGACVYADKLCQLLFCAREITVVYAGRTLVRWVRVHQHIGQWYQR